MSVLWKRALFGALVLVGVALIALTASGLRLAQADGEKITILHNNDLESALLPERDGLGGLARIATFVKQMRASEPRVLFLSGGDNVLAGDFFNFFLGEATYKAMSAAGYDAAGFGNHEFDRGEQVLADAISNYASFPYLASNLQLGDESPLKPLTRPFTITTIEKLRAGEHGGKIYDGLLVDYDGLKVCLFGLLDQEIERARITQLAPTTHITDPVEAAQRLKAQCEENGADLLVAMIHLAAAVRVDTVIKQQVPGIDVFVVGGTDALFDPKANPQDNVVETPEGPSLSVQGDGDGNRIGKLDLVVKDGRIVEFDYINLPVTPEPSEEILAEDPRYQDFPFSTAFAEDPEVQALVDSYASQVEALLDTVVGETLVTLDGKTQTNRQRETNIGNYITDCFLRKFPQAEIALHNGGGIRNDAPPGPLTFRDVQSITPFGNTIVLLDLTGEQILEALENSVSNVEGTQGRYLQVSGLEYAYDLTQPPGSRVIPGSVLVGGEPLNPTRVYKVATLNFLAAGGDRYDVFTRALNVLDTTFPQDAALSECIKEDQQIDPIIEGRVLSLIGWMRFKATDEFLGKTVKVRGIVTLAPGQAGLDAQTFYVQESSSGLRVRLAGSPPEELQAGSFVEVEGTFTEVNGQFELQNASVRTVTELEFEGEGLRFNVQPHEPQSVRLVNIQNNLEFYEGNLVRVEGIADPGTDLVNLNTAQEGEATLIGIVEQDGDVYQLRVIR